MSVQEEQERRSELLLRAFEAYSDPEQALAMALRMEQFIIGDQTSHEKPQEAVKPVVQPPVDQPRKKCGRSRWTGDDDAHLRRLWKEELMVEEIAQKLERTPASVYGRLRIMNLKSSKQDTKNGKRNVELPSLNKHPPKADSETNNGFETVGIDSVVHFLRTRDYSVVQTEDDRYDLDGHKVMTAQELFERANKVRARLKKPTWAALENGPKIEDPHKSKH
jgi:hypothetical protein